jgi:hypothetical protein
MHCDTQRKGEHRGNAALIDRDRDAGVIWLIPSITVSKGAH